jgi:predicted GNAT family acetyltransferase
MIRKLSQQDHDVTYRFLSKEPSINLFILGDIEAFGYESDFQELWGEFNDKGELNAVLLRYHQSFIPYAMGEFDVAGFTKIIKQYSGENRVALSGKTEIVQAFEGKPELTFGKRQVTYFAECNSIERLSQSNHDLEIKKATLADVDRILNIRQSIEEFNVLPSARDILVQSMESNVSRTYYTEEDGVITASASTAAEYSLAAMIVGVCTRKEYRRKGLASSVMQVLFRDVLNEGKTLCLFYDNPEAGRIYKRLGFVDIGMWTMYR